MPPTFYQFLQNRLRESTLPGKDSQIKMAPMPVHKGDPQRKMDAPPEANASSVLVLLFTNQQGLYQIIITLRSSSIDHGGQLSLPGGRAEGGERPVETAIREAREEIGINSNDVKIAGQLSKLYVAHSNNYVTPIVGFLDYSPKLTINPAEVEEAFAVTLDSLLDKKNLTFENWDLRDEATYNVPFWDIHRVPLWGATAMILSEFLQLYKEFLEKTKSNSDE